MSTSDWTTWFRNAEDHLTMAKRAMEAELDEIAYEKAVYAGECALKAVLIKEGKFSRDDWTHDQKKICQKIRELAILSDETQQKINDIVEGTTEMDGISHVDLTVESSHQDCPHIAQTRYPTDNYTSYDMLKSGNAEEKIHLAQEMIKILRDELF